MSTSYIMLLKLPETETKSMSINRKAPHGIAWNHVSPWYSSGTEFSINQRKALLFRFYLEKTLLFWFMSETTNILPQSLLVFHRQTLYVVVVYALAVSNAVECSVAVCVINGIGPDHVSPQLLFAVNVVCLNFPSHAYWYKKRQEQR